MTPGYACGFYLCLIAGQITGAYINTHSILLLPPPPSSGSLAHSPCPLFLWGHFLCPLTGREQRTTEKGVNKGSSCIITAAPSHLMAHLLTHPAPFPLFQQGTSCISLQPGNIVLREKTGAIIGKGVNKRSSCIILLSPTPF